MQEHKDGADPAPVWNFFFASDLTGHLREKSGYYYTVLNYTDSLGKRKTHWISTGLAVKGAKLELPILFGAFYGLRRSEAIGLKWDAIDFEQKTVTISGIAVLRSFWQTVCL